MPIPSPAASSLQPPDATSLLSGHPFPIRHRPSPALILKEMATSHDELEGDEDEYVMLDLDGVSDIPPNAPYVLSGLDTLNPILIIDDRIKLIGEYDETIGTCIVFSENDAPPVVHVETGPSEANLFAGKSIINPNQGPKKQVKPVCQLQKILRFKLLIETQADSTFEQPSINTVIPTSPSNTNL